MGIYPNCNECFIYVCKVPQFIFLINNNSYSQLITFVVIRCDQEWTKGCGGKDVWSNQ